jgi:hypothetical protein
MIDADLFPPPGICVGGWGNAIPVGQPCNPFGWQDPCVSGSVCALDAAGSAYACAQVCDPQPSPGISEPACLFPTTCHPFKPPQCSDFANAANNFACFHMGVCR